MQQTELSTQELAIALGCSPRMINIYRARIEEREGGRLGSKRGKTVYFSSAEQEAIRKEKILGNEAGQTRSQQRPMQPDFQQANYQAEENIAGGMDAIVTAGDQNAIAIGQALGMRWNGLMWTAALQSMQSGMVQMQQQFSELHASVTVGLNSADLPQLTGNSPTTPSLPEHFESTDEDED